MWAPRPLPALTQPLVYGTGWCRRDAKTQDERVLAPLKGLAIRREREQNDGDSRIQGDGSMVSAQVFRMSDIGIERAVAAGARPSGSRIHLWHRRLAALVLEKLPPSSSHCRPLLSRPCVNGVSSRPILPTDTCGAAGDYMPAAADDCMETRM